MGGKAITIKKEDLEEAIASFLLTLPSGNSRRNYGIDLRLFLEYLQEEGFVGFRVNDVAPEHIASFRDREVERVSPTTMRRRLCALRSFFAWAAQQGICAGNPAVAFPLPRKNTSHPVVLTFSEIERLISAPDTRNPMGVRDRAMLSLCYYAGLRVSELCSLRMDSLRWEHFPYKKKLRPAVVVEGKGGRVRAVPLSEETVEDLRAWLAVKPNVKEDSLFLLRSGRPLTPEAFRYTLRKYTKKAGIEKPITPHTLRHSFASHLAYGKVRLDLISDYLGHSDISTTKIYLHIADEEYAQGVDALPRSLRKGSRIL